MPETCGFFLLLQLAVKLNWRKLLPAYHPNGDGQGMPSFQRGLERRESFPAHWTEKKCGEGEISPLRRTLYIQSYGFNYQSLAWWLLDLLVLSDSTKCCCTSRLIYQITSLVVNFRVTSTVCWHTACSSQMLLVLDLPSRTANYELQLLQGHSWIFWMRCLPASSATWALLIIGLAFYLETDIQWKSFILLSSLNFCCIAYCLLWSSWDANLGRCFSKLKLRQCFNESWWSHHKTSLWQEVV